MKSLTHLKIINGKGEKKKKGGGRKKEMQKKEGRGGKGKTEIRKGAEVGEVNLLIVRMCANSKLSRRKVGKVEEEAFR